MFIGKSLLVVIGIFVGIFVGSMFPQLSGGLSKAQVEKVKKFFPVISEMKTLSGTVEKIDGQTVTLEISESSNPFDQWSTTRKVTVTDGTKIVRISQKTQIKDGGDSALPSAIMTEEKVVGLSEIKEGSIITVEADHNIKNETQFIATKITIGVGGPAGFGVPLGGGAPTNGNLPTPPPAPSGGAPTTGNPPTPPPAPVR